LQSVDSTPPNAQKASIPCASKVKRAIKCEVKKDFLISDLGSKGATVPDKLWWQRKVKKEEPNTI
jgi:hypothetical protein